MYCSEGILVKHEAGKSSARILQCRRWSCPLCQPDRQRQLVAKGISGHPNRFITLTVNPAVGTDPVHRAHLLVDAFRKVRRAAMREFKLKHFEFLAVLEAQKSGEPHLHVLARFRWIDQAWLSEQMRLHIGAPICDVRKITSTAQAAGYVAKYCGKEPIRFGTLKRYWSSRGYESGRWLAERPISDGPPRWERRNQSLDGWLETQRWLGHTVEQDRRWFVSLHCQPRGSPVPW